MIAALRRLCVGAVVMIAIGLPLRAAEAVTQSVLEKVQAARTAADAGQYSKAIGLAEKALAEHIKRSGHERDAEAIIEFDIATYLVRLRRYQDAIDRYQHVLEILHKEGGDAYSARLPVLRDYGTTLSTVGRFTDAERVLGEAVVLAEQVAKPSELRGLLAMRASASIESGRYEAAQSDLDRAISLYQADATADAELFGLLQSNVELAILENDVTKAQQMAERAADLANRLGDPLSQSTARYLKAVVDLRRGDFVGADATLAQVEQALPKSEDSLLPANVAYYRGVIFVARGQFVEAEAKLQESLAAYQARLGRDHPMNARVLHNLALIRQELGDTDHAQALFRQAIDALTSAFGADSFQVANTELELVKTKWLRREYDQAESLSRTALRKAEAASLPDPRLLATGYTALGLTLKRQGRSAEATAALLRGLDLAEQARGRDALHLTVVLMELAELNVEQKEWGQARNNIDRAISILRRTGSDTPSMLGRAIRISALTFAGSGDRARALELIREGSALAHSRGSLIAGGLSATAEREERVARSIYLAHVALCHDLMIHDGLDGMVGESFEIAQLAQSSTAAKAISEASARSAEQAGPLGALVRQRQDLVEHWRELDRARDDLLAQAGDDQHNRRFEEIETELQGVTEEVASLDRELKAEFPTYSELTHPAPSSIAAVQSALQSDEALLLQVTDEDASYVWLVGRDDAALVRSNLAQAEMADLVRAIRATLDVLHPTPFDAPSAFTLYNRLLGPLGDRVSRYRSLIFVADGPMQSLPLGILIDHAVEPPGDDDAVYADYPWLAARYVISNAPTVSSFLLLRSAQRRSEPKTPFAGFGDPVLGKGKGTSRGVTPQMAFTAGTQVDRGLFNLLAPLPETRQELKLIMNALGGSETHLYIGPDATERRLKSANLRDVRTIAFATHALLAGEFLGLAEPALIMTPPKKAKGGDDGLLTSSEISKLDLNADWVILSACNTAGPDGTPGADGYSGLTQAFFYAGARSLLVSHWYVDSLSAAFLTTGVAERIAKSPGLGRAEALQQSMLELLHAKVRRLRSHPAFWGPFVLVGDGSE